MPRVGEIHPACDAMWNGSHWVPRNSGLLGGLRQADSGMWMTSVGGALPQNSGQYYDKLGLMQMQNTYAELPDADNPVLLLLGN